MPEWANVIEVFVDHDRKREQHNEKGTFPEKMFSPNSLLFFKVTNYLLNYAHKVIILHSFIRANGSEEQSFWRLQKTDGLLTWRSNE